MDLPEVRAEYHLYPLRTFLQHEEREAPPTARGFWRKTTVPATHAASPCFRVLCIGTQPTPVRRARLGSSRSRPLALTLLRARSSCSCSSGESSDRSGAAVAGPSSSAVPGGQAWASVPGGVQRRLPVCCVAARPRQLVARVPAQRKPVVGVLNAAEHAARMPFAHDRPDHLPANAPHRTLSDMDIAQVLSLIARPRTIQAHQPQGHPLGAGLMGQGVGRPHAEASARKEARFGVGKRRRRQALA